MNQSSSFNKALLIAGLILGVLTACSKEKNSNTTSASLNSNYAKENWNAPAAHINASEKIVIPQAVELPANLLNGNTRIATFFAEGLQKYKAREIPGTEPTRYEWVLIAPDAELYDATNAKVGTHGAGPYWQLSPLDSIFAQHFSPAKTAPSPDLNSIDWLLLKPKTGITPTGVFTGVDYIQRIATKGGKAPLTPPGSATETIDVKYKAIYRFSRSN